MDYSVLLPYIVGTLVGLFMGYRAGLTRAGIVTMDMLIERGFLRHRRTSDGDIEILKYNETDTDEQALK